MSITDPNVAKRAPDDPFLVSTTADRKFAHWRIVLEKPDEVEPENVSEESSVSEEEVEYDSEEFVSKPSKSEKWTLPDNLLSTYYSFGYDSTKIYNLVAVDEDTLLFGSGALLHIFDIPTRQLTFRRTAGGGGIGHITKNLAFPHIAIGEKGTNPLLIVYEWPSFEVISVLREGTTKEYTHLNFSPDGKHLVSQGGEPDFLITVWNWKRTEIMLQVKSHTQDVFNVEFSRYFPGNLTSSGLGHIKFWKMAKTFTGLKLQGEIGKFGKTEICDIMGLYAMPDEKVLTGCEWGNILVWDEGMIKMQVARKVEGTPCHQGPITYFTYNHDDGYLLTAGLDGCIKIWFYRYINEQNPPDTDPFVRIEPSFSIEVKDEIGPAKLVSLTKVDEDPLNHRYFGQDYSGLWSIDAEMRSDLPKPVRLYCCHKGPIFDMVVSPISHHIVTIAEDARLHVYDIERKKLVLVKQFKTDIKVLLWLPSNVTKSGTVFVGGFIDGTIKIFVIEMAKVFNNEELLGDYVHIIYSEKFHVGAITKLVLDEQGTMLVSGGEDCSVFANRIVPDYDDDDDNYDRGKVQLDPIGFIKTPAPVTSISEKRGQSPTFLVCCSDGHFLEVTFPDKRLSSDVVSYELNLDLKLHRFASIKSEILRDKELKEIEQKKQAKLDLKKAEMENLRKENPHLDINEEIYLVDSEEELELPPLYIPQEPSPILFGVYDEQGYAWLSLGNYDSGFLYKFDMLDGYSSEAREYRLLLHDVEIISTCELKCDSHHLQLFGLSNGVIRVVNVDDEHTDDYCDYLDLSIHDNNYGRITKLVMSHDRKYLYSCGDDSNIFAFEIMIPDLLLERDTEEVGYSELSDKIAVLPDVGPEGNLSLEEEKKRIENLQRKQDAETRKEGVRKRLQNCREKFLKIIKRNDSLPAAYRLTAEQLEIDSRVTEHLEQKLQRELDLVKQKLSFDLEKSKLLYEKVHHYFIKPLASFKVSLNAIGKDIHVTTFVHKQLDEEFNKNYERLVKTYKPDLRNEARLEKIKPLVIEAEPEFVPVPLMPWLRGEDNFYDKLNPQTLRALDRHLARQKYNENRQAEWRNFMNSKPDINRLDARDLSRIDFAQRTVGDYKLKTSSEYKVPRHLRVSVAQKHRQLLIIRKSVYDEKNSFNKKVIKLRDQKVEMVTEFRNLYAILNELHKEIDPSLRKSPPSIPSIDVELEFPERKFQLHPEEIGLERDVAQQPTDEELMYLYPELMPFEYNDDIKNEEDTSWTKEKKEMRTVRRLVEQDSIISNMEMIIKQHNKRVEKLNWEKLEISVKIKLLEIFQLTVFQELVTIKCFEKLENELMDKVEAMLAHKSIQMFMINRNKKKILYATREINALQDKENDVLRVFQESVFESKFIDFLTKIYKKKYKPPKKKKDDDSESSSSEESSSDDSESESSDEGEMKIIKFDENICPEGCDPDIYKKTFVLRAKRHELELEIIEVKKRVEVLKKENEMSDKKLLQIDVVLRLHMEKLESFQRQKQRKVNEVETIVVLNSDQLLNYKKSDELGSIDNSVLIRMESLRKLNDRVGELQNETKAEQLKHEQYKIHLQRMRVDVKAMETQIEELKKKIKKEKMIKFGAEIDIDRLEDSVLKEMILAVRFDIASLQQDMEKKLKVFKENILAKAEEKARIQRENTHKLQMLSSLQDEKTKVKQMLNSQNIKKTKMKDKVCFENVIIDDVKHLEKLLEELNAQRETILQEIRILSLKGRALPPISKAGPTPKERVPKKKVPMLEKIESVDFAVELEEKGSRKLNSDAGKRRSSSLQLKLSKEQLENQLEYRKSSSFDIAVPQVDTGLKSASDTDTESPTLETPFAIVEEQDGELHDMCSEIVDRIVHECTNAMGFEIARSVLDTVVRDIGNEGAGHVEEEEEASDKQDDIEINWTKSDGKDDENRVDDSRVEGEKDVKSEEDRDSGRKVDEGKVGDVEHEDDGKKIDESQVEGEKDVESEEDRNNDRNVDEGRVGDVEGERDVEHEDTDNGKKVDESQVEGEEDRNNDKKFDDGQVEGDEDEDKNKDVDNIGNIDGDGHVGSDKHKVESEDVDNEGEKYEDEPDIKGEDNGEVTKDGVDSKYGDQQASRDEHRLENEDVDEEGEKEHGITDEGNEGIKDGDNDESKDGDKHLSENEEKIGHSDKSKDEEDMNFVED